MVNTPENKQAPNVDPLYQWGRERDPLRARHGLSSAEYGSAFEIFPRTRKGISDRLLELFAAFVVGATVTLLFF